MTGSSMKINWNFDTMQWEGITVKQVKLWERLYPDVDVVQQLKFEMPRWIDKRIGTKIVRKKDWKKTITNWLKREQEKGVGR